MSSAARHCDRYHVAGLDPQESDLPAALSKALLGLSPGATADIELPQGRLSALLCESTAAPAAGYLSPLFALRHGISRQADSAALAAHSEPYARAHEDDAEFYATTRLVDHLDTTAQAVWREFNARFVRDDQHILDLMASCDSHLPASSKPARVAGLGMNATELDHNPALTDRIVHDLNAESLLPLADVSFDLALCALSIEYLVQPEAVLAEVRRCLRPGGLCVISFSERWFPPKAVAPWPTLHPFARVAWVLRHLQRAGFSDLHTESLRGLPRPPDDKHYRMTQTADPLYAVWGVV